MRIAHLAPPWFAIPPRNYGGTENVLYHLIEAQVEAGHEVTVFTAGDSRTSATQVAFLEDALFDLGVPWQAHLLAFYHLFKSVEHLRQHAHDFDVVHSHLSSTSDLYSFPLLSHLN